MRNNIHPNYQEATISCAWKSVNTVNSKRNACKSCVLLSSLFTGQAKFIDTEAKSIQKKLLLIFLI